MPWIKMILNKKTAVWTKSPYSQSADQFVHQPFGRGEHPSYPPFGRACFPTALDSRCAVLSASAPCKWLGCWKCAAWSNKLASDWEIDFSCTQKWSWRLNTWLSSWGMTRNLVAAFLISFSYHFHIKPTSAWEPGHIQLLKQCLEIHTR